MRDEVAQTSESRRLVAALTIMIVLTTPVFALAALFGLRCLWQVLSPGAERSEGTEPGHAFTPQESQSADFALQEIRLERLVLGRGAKSHGKVKFVAPPGAPITLEARTSVPGYGFSVPIDNPAQGSIFLHVACYENRPGHLVEWFFALRDAAGNLSANIRIPIQCTGEVLDDPPRLEDVELETLVLRGPQRARGLATFGGGHRPMRLAATSDTPGYGWHRRYTDRQQQDFWVGCHENRPPHTVTWRFVAEDARGRQGNVIEKQVRCETR